MYSNFNGFRYCYHIFLELPDTLVEHTKWSANRPKLEPMHIGLLCPRSICLGLCGTCCEYAALRLLFTGS